MRPRAFGALSLIVLLLLAADIAIAAGPPQVGESCPPQVGESWVTGVAPTAADLRATIDPEGLATAYRFEYLTAAGYEANLAAARDGFAGAATAPSSGGAQLGSGTTPVAVAQHVGSLLPETAYRYRVHATNGAGDGYGTAGLFTTEQPTNVFPPIDGRAYELVSPVDKDGGAVGAPESIFGGGDLQAAADGESFTFSSSSSFGGAAGAPPASQYLSTRGSTGWATSNISVPAESGGYGDHPDGVPFRLFSPDLSRALMLDGSRCAAAGTCPPTYSLWTPGGLTTLPTVTGLRLAGATPDLDHAVFEAGGGLYEWSGGALETLSPGPGVVLAAPIGAVSADGRRVYAYQLEDGPISLLEAGQPPRALPGTTGDAARFQAASADGSLAFFTAEPGHLYRFAASTGTATDLTPAGGVVGVLGASAAGDVVYYQDGTGLERWSEGEGSSTIVPGAGIAAPSDYPPATATARVSADGEHLAFLSAASIPPFDNIDAESGEPDTELYLYGPPPGGGTPRLICASCNPTGERPSGSASLPGAVRNGTGVLYRPRVLSAGGTRVFFETVEGLVAPDTNGVSDVYEWEAGGVGGCAHATGCLGLISGGRGDGGIFLDASESGDDTFILTGESLVRADPGQSDVYDYRAGGGFPEPPAPIPCVADACQALPSPPQDPAPGTLVPTAGNPPLKVERLKSRRCPKGKVRRNGFCLRGLHPHPHHPHHHAKRRGHR